MKKITLIGGILLLLFTVSCGVPQADVDKLKKENEELKKELAQCELTPVQILDQANTFYDQTDYTKSREYLQILIAKYVDSDETKKGKQLLKKVENKILETARTNRDNDKKVEEDIAENIQKEESEEESSQKVEEAVAKMKIKYDINDDVTWYSDSSSSVSNAKSYIQTYIGKKEKKPWIGLSVNYFSKKKWLHLERIEITVDGEIFEIEEETPGEFKAGKVSGGKREWLDRVIKKDDILLTEKIASSKITKIKFVGEDDVYTKTVSKTEKKALQNVLDAYIALGGSMD